MNISSDRFGAKTIVLIVAGIVIGATCLLIYRVVVSQGGVDDPEAVCRERGVGTHVINPEKSTKQTVIMCGSDGSSQVLRRP